MNLNLFLAASNEGIAGMAQETAQTFGINWSLFISQSISFIIVCILLYKFAYNPILKVLDQRRQRIAESLENAEKIKKELAETEQARKEILSKANTQATGLIDEARKSASELLDKESQKAVKQAEEIIAKARQAAEADRDRMMDELKKEIGRLVVETTGKVTGKILSVEDQKRLVDETNKEIAA